MKKTCSHCFKNLGVGSRAKIYTFLESNGEKNVTEITSHIGLKQPTVSYHLSQMLKTGLLEHRLHGKEAFYKVNQRCPHDGEHCVVYSAN